MRIFFNSIKTQVATLKSQIESTLPARLWKVETLARERGEDLRRLEESIRSLPKLSTGEEAKDFSRILAANIHAKIATKQIRAQYWIACLGVAGAFTGYCVHNIYFESQRTALKNLSKSREKLLNEFQEDLQSLAEELKNKQKELDTRQKFLEEIKKEIQLFAQDYTNISSYLQKAEEELNRCSTDAFTRYDLWKKSN